MSIYVKETIDLKNNTGTDYTLYADTAVELDSDELTTENYGDIVCQPGSKAYTNAGEVFILHSSGTWTQQ